MDNNVILLMFNLVMLAINLWTQNRTLQIQNDIIKRDQDFVLETTKLMSRVVGLEKDEE